LGAGHEGSRKSAEQTEMKTTSRGDIRGGGKGISTRTNVKKDWARKKGTRVQQTRKRQREKKKKPSSEGRGWRLWRPAVVFWGTMKKELTDPEEKDFSRQQGKLGDEERNRAQSKERFLYPKGKGHKKEKMIHGSATCNRTSKEDAKIKASSRRIPKGIEGRFESMEYVINGGYKKRKQRWTPVFNGAIGSAVRMMVEGEGAGGVLQMGET